MRLLLFSLLALTLPTAAPKTPSVRSESTGSAALCADMLPQAIRSLASLAQKTKIIFGQSTEGAHAIAYLHPAGHIRAVEVTFFGESGRTMYEFYYVDGKVDLARQREFIYNAPIYMNHELTEKIRREEGVIQEAFDDRKTKVQENLYCFGSSKPFGQKESSDPGEANVRQISKEAYSEFSKE